MGEQARADRYTYMPLVGCFIMAAWGAGEFVEKRRLSKEVVWTAAVVALSAMVLATWVQVGHWRNGVSLFSRAIAVDADNVWGYYNAALALAEEGKDGEAVRYYHESIRLRPDHPDVYKAHMSLAQSLERLGKPEDALAEYREVLKRRPLEAQALNNIGIILAQQGGLGDAIVHYRAALSILPDDPQLRLNLGMAMSLAGRTDEAIAQFEEVVRRRPDDAQARLIMERALSERAGKK
jgi:tetratricopeptide (TPR) repeat protein